MKIKYGSIATAWCVYTVSDSNRNVLYAGTSRLTDAYNLSELRALRQWRDATPASATLDINVMSVHDDAKEAETFLVTLVAIHNPPFNAYPPAPSATRVECVTTGEIFDNPSQAARMYGASNSQMYMHINGKPGYRTVKGKIFRRIPA